MEWVSTPKLQIAQSYDDNVGLDAAGSERSEHITQLRPGINLIGRAKNSKLNLSYQLENIIYKDDVNKDQIYHHGSIVTASNFANKRLFLDTKFGYSQTNISAEDTLGLDNLAISTNRTDRFDYRISPYLITSIGSFVDFNTHYTHSGIDYDNNQSLSDSSSNRVAINFNNHKSYNRLVWDINYSNNETKYDSGGRVEFSDANLALKYLVTSKTYVLATAGDENNNYFHNTLDKAPEGSYWRAGLGWRPSKRTLVEVQSGDRFFGSTKKMLINHHTKLSNWTIRYDEILGSQNTDEVALRAGINDALNQPVISTDTLANLSSVFTTEVYLSQKLDFTVTWSTKKSLITLAGYDEKRTYQVLKDEDKTQSASLSWGWRFLSNTSLNIREAWLKQKFRTSGRIDELSDTTIELERKIQPKLSGKLAFRTIKLDSNVPANDYQRNLITLTVDMLF